jgi:heme exporter protein A
MIAKKTPDSFAPWASAMTLAAHALACIRGGRLVFADLSFSVQSGHALVLTGPNGAGKSSLLRTIAGLIQPAAGEVVLHGGDSELTPGEQAHYVGHLDPLKPSLTVRENLGFWTQFLNGGRPGAFTIHEALAATALSDLAELPAGYLSAGQRRRLSLARVLAIPRPIWLLDEPTTALDGSSQERLRRLMREHLTAKGIIIAATHGPLGLEQWGELRLGAPASPPGEGDTVEPARAEAAEAAP